MATISIPRTARLLFSPGHRPQTLSRTHTSPSPSQIRTVFRVPQLYHEQDERFSKEGIVRKISTPEGPKTIPLYSGGGFNLAWTAHQTHLLHNVNYLTMSEPESQGKDSILALVKQHARDPSQAVLFNYASQAHNNHFFFNSITDRPEPLTNFPDLRQNLERAFGSVDALRDMMRYTADGIFGSGFVWLVWAKCGAVDGWRVLATYNAGTPYVLRPDGSVDRTQGTDMNNASPMQAGSFGRASANGQVGKLMGGADEITPVLCLSVWEHSFIRDHFVHGKRDFVDAWWECVDWAVVNERAPGKSKDAGGFSSLGS